METTLMACPDFGRQQTMYHPLASVTKCLLAERKGYGQETVTKGHRVPGQLGGTETSLQGGAEQAGSMVKLVDWG